MIKVEFSYHVLVVKMKKNCKFHLCIDYVPTLVFMVWHVLNCILIDYLYLVVLRLEM